MKTESFEKYESSVRSYCRHFPTVFKTAKGSIITDEEGNDYIDFFCGAGAVNYGHNNEYIKEKTLEYFSTDGIIHALDMYTVPKREFIETFETKILEPRGYNYRIQFPGPTGTNAVEAALKLARKYTGRRNIFAFMGCFHGMTLGALSATSEMFARNGAIASLTDCTHIPAPYMVEGLDVVKYMQMLIDDDHSATEKPAAVIMETVQAEGGIRVFDVEFLKAVREFCTKNDILMIVDDIQIGCCRSGSFFSFERAGIQPDIVVMSKSIGGIGMPMSVVLHKPEIDVWKPGEHNGTFRGNQLSFVAGKAAIEYLIENNVEAETVRKGEIVKNFVEKEILPLNDKLELRGIGLMWGIDCSKVDPALASKLSDLCFTKNLICEVAGREGSVFKIMPALVIEDELLLKGLNIIKESFKELLANY